MPRTSTSTTRRPILGRAMAILTTLPLTPISKARAARTLLLFKRRRARRLRHYSYAYVGEYQFSPSGSPLLLPRPPGLSAWRSAGSKRRSAAKVFLSSLLCGGCGAGGDAVDVAVLDCLPPPRTDPPRAAYGERDDDEVYGYDEEEEEYGEDEEVDSRAERFIERFYQEMRMQETRRLLI
ncbi:uncharacterized protein LOC124664293 [Lolium rigidum]|uniref:uncharacterized protein LOC124664293 n=1 Tax=Lolium rigidum TaxID=89674 RepID=UPI001F5C9CD8|nr:uncharacterized protein LOC124664293 [Lolium rigidum]